MKQFIVPILLGLGLTTGCQKKENAKVVDTGNLDSAQASVAVVGDPKLLYTLANKHRM